MSQPNILLVVLDSARAKNCGLYGYHRETTPFLSQYAERATVYEQARAPGIHSVASHASMWTGEHVEEHQAIRHADRIDPADTIWSDLVGSGYRTGLFTGNAIVTHTSNLAEPFETTFAGEFVDTKQKLFPDAHGPADVTVDEGLAGNLQRCLQDDAPLKAVANSAHHVYLKLQRHLQEAQPTSGDYITEFLDWQQETDEPWAACINLLDPHFPYEPSPEHDKWGSDDLRRIHSSLSNIPAKEFTGDRPWWQLEAFEHLYDGAIHEADAHVRRIVEGLDAADQHEDTLVVVTSDHGEGFGEVSRLTGTTKMVGHNWGIHEVLTHVPLVVKFPGQTHARRVTAPVSLASFPAVAEAVVDGSAGYDAFVSDRPVVASTYRLLEEDAGILETSAEPAADYTGPWRAVYDGSGDTVRKYASKDDASLTAEVYSAQERVLVANDDGGVVKRTFAQFDTKPDSQERNAEPESTVTDRLEKLGYIT